MKKFNHKNFKYEWMKKYPWLTRIYLILALIYIPVAFVVLTLYENFHGLKEALSAVSSAAFLPWEKDNE